MLDSAAPAVESASAADRVPGSDFAGESIAAIVTFANVPQLIVPGSGGGVKFGMQWWNRFWSTFGSSDDVGGSPTPPRR